jgi:putative flavoprotein involved in K+ transport
MKNYDCVVIGGGQSGLYISNLLRNKDISYILLERDQVGQVWENRWEGLRLFTSRQFCGLPGLAFKGEPYTFPTAQEMAEYLRDFAKSMNLLIRESSEVTNLSKENGQFIITLKTAETLKAKAVIIATGSNQIPIIPPFSKNLSKDVLQFNGALKSLQTIPEKSRVVVVGDGATGRQIAGNLTKRCDVTLATGRPRALPPGTILGKDLFWWLNIIGVLKADKHSKVARLLRDRNPVPCGNFNDQRLKTMGVRIVGRAQDCSDRSILFEGSQTAEADVVVWAMGYRDNTDWLKLTNCINEKEFVEEYGTMPEPGLFIIGRKWLSCRASELIMGLPQDADRVVRELEKYLTKQQIL